MNGWSRQTTDLINFTVASSLWDDESNFTTLQLIENWIIDEFTMSLQYGEWNINQSLWKVIW
jgi:hypothetical protein